MLKCISLPSQLRRRIAVLARTGQAADSEANFANLPDTTETARLCTEYIDTACSVLQGSDPVEAADHMRYLLGLMHGFSASTGSKDNPDIPVCIRDQMEPMIDLCLDPQWTQALEAERYPLPSHLHQSETVLLANGSLMAESYRLFLESFGIQCILGRESAGVVYGLTVGPLGEVDVKVSPENAADAKILLTAMQRGYFIRPEHMDEDFSEPFDSEMDEMDESETLDDL